MAGSKKRKQLKRRRKSRPNLLLQKKGLLKNKLKRQLRKNQLKKQTIKKHQTTRRGNNEKEQHSKNSDGHGDGADYGNRRE